MCKGLAHVSETPPDPPFPACRRVCRAQHAGHDPGLTRRHSWSTSCARAPPAVAFHLPTDRASQCGSLERFVPPSSALTIFSCWVGFGSQFSPFAACLLLRKSLMLSAACCDSSSILLRGLGLCQCFLQPFLKLLNVCALLQRSLSAPRHGGLWAVGGGCMRSEWMSQALAGHRFIANQFSPA